jgi:hypothetical protein
MSKELKLARNRVKSTFKMSRKLKLGGNLSKFDFKMSTDLDSLAFLPFFEIGVDDP